MRKLTTGYYRPTKIFKSIPEHIAVMFEDDQTLVALFGASDDPANLADTMECAELFASAPEKVAALKEIESMCDSLMGEWESVLPPYLPEDMMGLFNIREAARTALNPNN